MGQSKLKSMKDGEVLSFDFGAVDLHVLKGDRQWLAKASDGTVDETRIQERAVRFTISNLIQATFPQGMDRRDGKIWADWLEVLDEEAGSKSDVTRGMVEWLKKQFAKDETKIQSALVQWRECVLEYIEEVVLSEPASS